MKKLFKSLIPFEMYLLEIGAAPAQPIPQKVPLKPPQQQIKQPDKPLFQIKLQEGIPNIPGLDNPILIDVRYPLIEPYAYAHIYWDKNDIELIYKIEEPLLSQQEKNLLDTLEEGIKEIINLSFISVSDSDVLILYLEKNIKILLSELSIKVTLDAFLKIMYYIYRDFVGLNELEPLMNDYFIEDIECNGVNSPVYIVHRKYRNIKTSLIYNDIPKMASFVEKLAQKCGKYVSYAEPLLDGSLPDNSRVNATYTKDISSKGPTITIRKFVKEPWSPLVLMQKRTVSAEVLAYIWMLIEYENSVMVIGGTGSGKTSFLNCVAFFIPAQSRVVSIEDSVTGDSKIIIKQNNKIRITTIKELVDKELNAQVLTLNDKGRIIFTKPSKYIKHKIKKDVYEITTATGRKIKVTKDHSLFSAGGKGLKEVKPTELKENNSFIAVPRSLPIDTKPIEEINLIDHLNKFKEFFLSGEPIKKIFQKYTLKDLKVSRSKYKWWKNNNLIRIDNFLRININFSTKELKEIKIKTKNKVSIPIIFKITPEFLQYSGLWLGDGCYDNYNKNVVIISNTDKECRDLIKDIANNLGSNYSIMTDNGVSIRIHNRIFYRFMKEVLELKGYSNTKKIPEFIFNLSNDQIKHFIKGYFSADGWIRKNEICCASQSYELLEDLQTLLLRQGIIARINKHTRQDRCIDMAISSNQNIQKFKEIGFLQKRKNIKLNAYNKPAKHNCSDIIPLTKPQLDRLNNLINNRLQWQYKSQINNLGRDYLQRIAPPGSEFNDLSHNDILWDKVVKIKKVSSDEIEVFDLSIPKYEKFLCNNIFVHNTRELKLEHENWLPSVSRAGVGLANISGQKYGEVSLFDLLKASFRQRPDYIIVGEIRGQEAYILFQAMASGHPSMATMHAENVETMIRRLETPPINLSGSLVMSVAAVVVISQTRVKGQEVRRISHVDEIIEVKENLQGQTLNPVFIWDPGTDTFRFNPRSYIFHKIGIHYGLTQEQVMQEFKIRTMILNTMYKNGIIGFKEVQKVIHEYYKSPQIVLKKLGLIK
ncbi:Flp pilus assembly complex ATPase component TadA [Candidatus Woesearchaeota archaeon]|nr:Flp pilus assembly complex ATPase component TadA [Candidatus Woesearchaeota archaeon]